MFSQNSRYAYILYWKYALDIRNSRIMQKCFEIKTKNRINKIENFIYELLCRISIFVFNLLKQIPILNLSFDMLIAGTSSNIVEHNVGSQSIGD